MLKIMKKQLFTAALLAASSTVTPMHAAPSPRAPFVNLASSGAATDEIIEQVLVKVNGDIITKTELEQRQVAALRQKMQGQVDPASLKNDETLKKQLAEITPQLIVNSIDELLLLQRGRELGLKLGDDQFKQ